MYNALWEIAQSALLCRSVTSEQNLIQIEDERDFYPLGRKPRTRSCYLLLKSEGKDARWRRGGETHSKQRICSWSLIKLLKRAMNSCNKTGKQATLSNTGRHVTVCQLELDLISKARRPRETVRTIRPISTV